jgi:hypothetical protein
MSLEEASIIVCAMEEHIKKNPRKSESKKARKGDERLLVPVVKVRSYATKSRNL